MLIAIDKPYGMVTRKLDNEVANALGDDGVGHIGTLDPAVTGVVMLCVGQARKLISLIEDGKTKSYRAVVEFGTQTDTDDAQGQAMLTVPTPACVADPEYAQKVVASFVGEQDQVPPKYSAIKVNGVRAYDRARAGEDFELPARRVHVFHAAFLGMEGTPGNAEAQSEAPVRWTCDFSVSAGTYIRAIARDMGIAVGGAAHLAELCRTSSGNVSLTDCVSLDAVREAGKDGVSAFALDPTKVLGLPVLRLSQKELALVQNGRSLARPGDLGEGQLVSLVFGNRLYGVWVVRDGRLRACTNCPLGIEGVRS